MRFSKTSQRAVLSLVLATALIFAGASADHKMTITLVLGSGGTIGGDTEETYVLTIPESLTITQDG